MRGKDKTQFLNKMKVSLDANMFNQTLDKMTDDGLVNYHDKLTRQMGIGKGTPIDMTNCRNAR